LPAVPLRTTGRPDFPNHFTTMPVLVGKKAPSFSAKAVLGETIIENFSLDQYLGKKYVIFFFYPKDFTFVCPTELHRFQEELGEFESRNVAVVGCSTDSEFSHWAWLQTPKAKGGIEGVQYPLVADVNKTISDAYDVLAGEYEVDENGSLTVKGELVAYRGLFLIDKEGIVRHQIVNDMPLGRSIREALRVVDALQHFEQFGEVCPMDWSRGDKAMTPDHEGNLRALCLYQVSDTLVHLFLLFKFRVHFATFRG
jgi:peroxiredoxin (alkyl hydroperoxide reductase subunit C)